MFNGLTEVFNQPGLAYPRGGFRTPGGNPIPLGDSYVERIVPSISHARVRGPTFAGISSPFPSASSSPGSFQTVPLNSPASTRSLVSSPSVYEGVASRIASSRSAAVLARLGPLGVALGVALVAATAIGAVVAFIKQPDSTIPEAVDEAVDEVLPDVNTPPKESEPVVDSDPWAGNVPWQRRPGRDLSLKQLFQINPGLAKFDCGLI